MHINDFLFLLSISKQDQEISSCSCSGLSLPGRGHVLVRCSHTVTGLRTLFLVLPFLDLLWISLVPSSPYQNGSKVAVIYTIYRVVDRLVSVQVEEQIQVTIPASGDVITSIEQKLR